MRKYYKLCLFIVTAVSLVFLIFYKTQYDRLYNVLQVLEFFGRDGGGTKPDRLCCISHYKPLCMSSCHFFLVCLQPLLLSTLVPSFLPCPGSRRARLQRLLQGQQRG